MLKKMSMYHLPDGYSLELIQKKRYITLRWILLEVVEGVVAGHIASNNKILTILSIVNNMLNTWGYYRQAQFQIVKESI